MENFIVGIACVLIPLACIFATILFSPQICKDMGWKVRKPISTIILEFLHRLIVRKHHLGILIFCFIAFGLQAHGQTAKGKYKCVYYTHPKGKPVKVNIPGTIEVSANTVIINKGRPYQQIYVIFQRSQPEIADEGMYTQVIESIYPASGQQINYMCIILVLEKDQHTIADVVLKPRKGHTIDYELRSDNTGYLVKN